MIQLDRVVDGSFRDPSGQVFESQGRVFRTVNERARAAYEATTANGLLNELYAQRRLVSAVEIAKDQWPTSVAASAYLLEHERIPCISYPYEWCFDQLKDAALLHINLQLDLFERGFVLSDATAYNVQFIDSRPIFIDTLSIRPYQENEFWSGHRQFCEQFLNPLLLRSLFGVPHNAWFRGSLEGIPTSQLAPLLSLRQKMSWNIFSHVTLQAKLDARAVRMSDSSIAKAKNSRGLSRMGYLGILRQMKSWISKLQPANRDKTVWGDYAKDNTYSSDEARAKTRAVQEFAETVKPAHLIDLGCNSGDYSIAALDGGAGRVVGFDFDHRAVELAYARSRSKNLNFLPLWLDASNPSPNQGWNQKERTGFATRFKSDALIALAFEHHLAIGKNVPMPQVTTWLTDVAPTGIIEFVPKADPTVQKMLSLREDIFPNYSEEDFVNALSANAKIQKRQTISSSGRVLFTYTKDMSA